VSPPVRHRTAPTPTRPPNRRDATTPVAFRPPLRREVSPYVSIPCWWSAERWMDHVARVYQRSYLLLRPRLVASSGGGISLPTVLAYAAAQAAAADHRTGRSSRPSITSMATTAARGRRTIQRARLFLRLAGLATEVQPGRTRTYPERISSWERGDRSRGWTAVYALHPSPTYPDPVDNSRVIRPGQTPDGTPPRSGSLPHSAPAEKRVSTRDADQEPPAGDEDGAPRRASTTKSRSDLVTSGTRAPGTALMLAWRTDPACPGWAKAYAAHRWAGALTAPAAAGWTARDLTQMLIDLTNTGHHILTRPRRPISYLLALLNKVDLNEPPTLTRDLHDAAHQTERAEQATERAVEQAESDRARQTAIAALTGTGRTLALEIAATTAVTAAQRRAGLRQSEYENRAELVARQRRQHQPSSQVCLYS
jgi:hypothetical protein